MWSCLQCSFISLYDNPERVPSINVPRYKLPTCGSWSPESKVYMGGLSIPLGAPWTIPRPKSRYTRPKAHCLRQLFRKEAIGKQSTRVSFLSTKSDTLEESLRIHLCLMLGLNKQLSTMGPVVCCDPPREPALRAVMFGGVDDGISCNRNMSTRYACMYYVLPQSPHTSNPRQTTLQSILGMLKETHRHFKTIPLQSLRVRVLQVHTLVLLLRRQGNQQLLGLQTNGRVVQRQACINVWGFALV